MNHIFRLKHIILLLIMPCLLYGMDTKKRPRDDKAQEMLLKPSKRVKTSKPFSEEITEAIFKHDIKTLGTLLTDPQAKDLNAQQRKKLAQFAKDALAIEYFPVKKESQSVKPSNEMIKNAQKIVYLLEAFKYLKDFNFPQTHFSGRPYSFHLRPSLDKIIEAFIINEQEKISACYFHFTLFNIAEELVKEKNKGVTVELITNQKQGYKAPLQALGYLILNDIPVFAPQNDKYEMNHHKFIIFHKNIFDKKILIRGSYNPTGHSTKRSWEDITITDNQNTIKEFERRFKEIKKASKPLTPKDVKKLQYPSRESKNINNVPPIYRDSAWFNKMEYNVKEKKQ